MAGDMISVSVSLFGFSNTSPAALEVFIIVINIFVRRWESE